MRGAAGALDLIGRQKVQPVPDAGTSLAESWFCMLPYKTTDSLLQKRTYRASLPTTKCAGRGG